MCIRDSAEGLLEANAWALKMEKEEGKNYEYFRPLSLCRKPRDSHTFPSVTDEQRALIENIWFDERFARNLGTVEMLYTKFTSVASEREWPSCPSYSTVARYVSYLMNDLRGESARFYAANGSREWKNQRMIKGKRNVSALQVMEFVQGDEHTFDCWVQVTHSNGKIAAVRPKLVAWLDTRSRCILGDVMCIDANAQTLKESLVKMLYSTPGGVPKHLHIDNGKDYTAAVSYTHLEYPDRYGVKQATDYFDKLFMDRESVIPDETMIKSRDDAMMLAASIIYSGSGEFPYEVEFLDGTMETEAATISRIRIKRKR